MNQIVRVLGSAAVTAALTATAGVASVGYYTVSAYSDDYVTLNLCSSRVGIVVAGDGDTDLDFRISDPTGTLVYLDDDSTDWTRGMLYNPYGGCVDFHLQVSNIGSVYNEYRVELYDY